MIITEISSSTHKPISPISQLEVVKQVHHKLLHSWNVSLKKVLNGFILILLVLRLLVLWVLGMVLDFLFSMLDMLLRNDLIARIGLFICNSCFFGLVGYLLIYTLDF